MSQGSPQRLDQPLYTPTFFVGFVYNFLIVLHFSNNVIYSLYVTNEGGSATEVGLFMGLYAVAAVLGRPLVGYLIDKRGIKLVFILGSLTLALPNLGFAYALDSGLTPLVWLLRLIQGFGFGAHFSASFTFAGVIAPEGRRNESMAMYGLSGMVGAIIGPPLGEFLVTDHGLTWFLYFMAATGVLGFISILFLHDDGPSRASDFSLRRLKTLLFSKELRLTLFLAMLLAVCFSTPNAFLAKLASERSVVGFGLYFSGLGVGGIVIRLIGGKWGDKFGLRRVLLPSFAAYGVALIVLYFSHATAWFIVAGVIAGVGHGLTFPAVTALGYTLAPRSLSGSIMAFVTGMMDVGAAITAFALGIIAESFGYGIIFLLASSGSITAVAMLYYSMRVRPEQLHGPTAQDAS